MTVQTHRYEEQAETHRAHIAALIAEMREHATPGAVVDEILGAENGRDIARNFGRQVRNNPLSLALVGAGLAWLMLGGTGSRDAGGAADGSDGQEAGSAQRSSREAGDPQSGIAAGVASATDNLSSRASQAAESMGSTVGEARDAAIDAAREVSQAVSSGAERTRQAAGSAAHAVTNAGARFNRLVQEQPLLMAGIGIAIGATFGALLPVTGAEHEIFARSSDGNSNRVRAAADRSHAEGAGSEPTDSRAH